MPRALSQLIKPAPTLVFRYRQQRFKLVSLGLIGQSGQTLPGSERSPVTDLRDQTRQGFQVADPYRRSHRRDADRIGEEGAKIPNGAQLERKPKAVVSTASLTDQHPVSIVQVEIAC